MPSIVRVTSSDGSGIEFIDELAAKGSVKDVFFSPDRSYVVALYRERQTAVLRDRLQTIVQRYRHQIFESEGGEYWKNVFCWPEKLFEYQGRLGVKVPTYADAFFFRHGSLQNDSLLRIQGKDKQGKWFATAMHRRRYLDPRELGDWRNYFRLCIQMARAVRRMHAAGLAHSDLSYKNVLIDPVSGRACVIDIDGLVVPGKFPPDVIGTEDFIAPEVVRTRHLHAAQGILPSIATDRHALAVLIYMYLLYRHPLKGHKVHDTDPNIDNALMMGERALFVENPNDRSNTLVLSKLTDKERQWCLPWMDLEKIPYTVTGPFLGPLFARAFTSGLQLPQERPTASEWEDALVKTVDLLLPCKHANCTQKWFVAYDARPLVCPFCSAPYQFSVPVFNLYSRNFQNRFAFDNQRLAIHSEQMLYPWHCDRGIVVNERLPEPTRKRVGYFAHAGGVWWLANEQLEQLTDITLDGQPKVIRRGEKLELKASQRILLSNGEGGRLALVQMH